MPRAMEILECQVHVSLCWTPSGSHMEWRTRSWLILSSQNDPLLGPQFHPLCAQLAAPYLCTPEDPGPNSKLCTQMQVLGPASSPVSHWPCPGRASHPWD